MCKFLSLSRSQFQTWKRFEMTSQGKSDAELLPVVTSIFHRHRRRYGSRRIVAELNSQGICCGRERVSKLMRNAGLKAISPKSFKPRTTESRHRLGYSPNLLLDLAEPSRPHRLWVGDISYIPVAEIGFGYLSVLMDRFTRRITGWSFREDMSEALTLGTLRKSIRSVQPCAGLIHHTDRGGQYAGTAYRSVLRRAQMEQSMSRAGDCYDNAFMESCFGTIKNELEMTEYKTVMQAASELAEYIHYYNHERRHSSLGYLTPTQFEAVA
ncbi:MAG: IS3 family transposase [Planctomycetales bacterium]|nr:IS3 family transposase [Planctomycetales bacterium]